MNIMAFQLLALWVMTIFFVPWKIIALLSYLELLRIHISIIIIIIIIILSFLLVDFLPASADTCVVAKIQSRGRALYTELARHNTIKKGEKRWLLLKGIVHPE